MSACGRRTLGRPSGQIPARPAPDCWAVGARSTLIPRASSARRVAGPIVATCTLPGSHVPRVAPRSAALASSAWTVVTLLITSQV